MQFMARSLFRRGTRFSYFRGMEIETWLQSASSRDPILYLAHLRSLWIPCTISLSSAETGSELAEKLGPKTAILEKVVRAAAAVSAKSSFLTGRITGT